MLHYTDLPLISRARAASHTAPQRYPNAIGELLSHELSNWACFGHRFGGHELVTRLVDHLDELDTTHRPATPRPRLRGLHQQADHFTDIAPATARLAHPDTRTLLYAALYARRSAYPTPVGEFVARALEAYIDTNMRLASSALIRCVLDELLALPGAARLRQPTSTADPPPRDATAA